MLHHYRVGDVGADQIEQFERTHAEAGGLLHQQIDFARAGDALRRRCAAPPAHRRGRRD